jgi:hypothetical protein
MADLLDQIQREMQARLDHLRPAVEKARVLEKAIAALSGDERPRAKTRTQARSEHGASQSPVPAGTAAARIVEVVSAEAGLTTSAIADRLGMNRAYGSQVVSRLVRVRHLRRRKRRLYAVR